ncbi:adhesive plaque matrix protein 2-like isoform X1 [Homalodisca vitripennis]|nr:adhesive plaque matrix protein 2-like isoform X1 [Homalodisca vitripennis]KAG8247522.1 hypothetical protein J6590_058557 [Homalodisca vitripennis]
MHWGCVFSLALALLLASAVAGPGCEERQGCRIQQGQCLCGSGCIADYVYANKEECRTALRGRRGDVCQRSPCLNNGSCSQTTLAPGYKCRCEGTGFYGNRCQNACPRPGKSMLNHPVPFECIVI